MTGAAFTLPWNAGIAVVTKSAGRPAALDARRMVAIDPAEAEDAAGLIQRLHAMRGEDGVEFLLVPSDLLDWLDARADLAEALERAFELVERDEASGAVFSLHGGSEGRTAPDGLPLPPVHLVRITSGSVRQANTDHDLMYRSFFQSGLLGSKSIRNMVALADQSVDEMESILDFGCGCGRVTRHWQHLGGAVHGCDYNPHLVDWCTANLPFASFSVNRAEPPLPYEDDRFDFVYSLSVFTHLDERLQTAWIDELVRVLRPGGLLLTSLKTTVNEDVMDADDVERFERGELVVKRPEVSGRNDCAAFHPLAYIEREMARDLELLHVVPGGARDVRQDAVLFRVPG